MKCLTKLLIKKHLKYITKGILSLIVLWAMIKKTQDTRQAVCFTCAVLMFIGLLGNGE